MGTKDDKKATIKPKSFVVTNFGKKISPKVYSPKYLLLYKNVVKKRKRTSKMGQNRVKMKYFPNLSETLFAEVYPPKFYLQKLFVFNVVTTINKIEINITE